jgi:hypothetical protein
MKKHSSFLWYEEPVICLYAFAYTREQLIQEIYEQIVFMWNEYVKSTDAN